MANQLVTSEDEKYKIILVGDVNVGKTTLFWRYTEGQFLPNKQTLVTTIDFKMKCVEIQNQKVKLYIWDTAGSQKYRSIVSTYFKGCNGVMIVFDLSREDSFKNAINQWYPAAKAKTPHSVFTLIGNKRDLDIRVDQKEVKKWCEEHKMNYIETSVKENINVMQAFDGLARNIYSEQHDLKKSQSFLLKSKGTEKRKCC